jgi:glucokinase
LTDLDARVKHRMEARIADNTPAAAVAALRNGVAAMMAETERSRILPAIGLGTPGLVDVHDGVIKSAVDIGWLEVPIQTMVEEAVGMRAFVANRSKVGALAEHWYGVHTGIEEIIYISIGSGIAAGVVHEGKLYVGSNSSAGELGHVTILPDGPLCPCGNRGCLQQLASGPAIANRARERLRGAGDTLLRTLVGDYPERVTAATVFQAAEQGDSLALAVVEEAARYLGIAIANLVNLFNPQLIVVGGPVGHAGSVLFDPMREEVRRRAMAYPLSAVQIVPSSLGASADAIGAAVLVLQEASELIFARK